jgi:hypothetical protein
VRRSLRLGLPAVGLTLGLALYPTLSGSALVLLAVPAACFYVMALVGLWRGLLGVAAALLALEYLASVYLRGGGLDLLSPVYAAALFVCVELGWLALEAGQGRRPWAGRVLAIAALALAGAGVGFALLLVALLPLPGGAVLTAGGVVAAVGVAAALAWLARAHRAAERQC